ncbi:Unconventional myosin-IXa [Desmophyllum pertusum]|uniref:Unconventional myosin-IXa n=1 Tax=Desmophyllum pertusum TaxID=174260 RepID=A0A9X0D3P7_9CNID|nr:Unconventional myosin-IXa [Desmophyllum pertusum]
MACIGGNRKTCELFLRNGADIMYRALSRSTPLHLAAWQGYEDICQLLIETAASMTSSVNDYVNITNKEGTTALHGACMRAAKHGHLTLVELLILYGVVTDVRDGSLRTPLHRPGQGSEQNQDRQALPSPQAPCSGKIAARKLIRGTEELGLLERFLMNKVSILNKEENKRDTIVDRVFRKALQEFHIQLISSYSVLMKEDKSFTVKYEDLMGQFEFTLNKIIKSELIIDKFPVIMGVNAFGGVLSEFITQDRDQKPKRPSTTRNPI